MFDYASQQRAIVNTLPVEFGYFIRRRFDLLAYFAAASALLACRNPSTEKQVLHHSAKFYATARRVEKPGVKPCRYRNICQRKMGSSSQVCQRCRYGQSGILMNWSIADCLGQRQAQQTALVAALLVPTSSQLDAMPSECNLP
jgi:hypothetical protein